MRKLIIMASLFLSAKSFAAAQILNKTVDYNYIAYQLMNVTQNASIQWAISDRSKISESSKLLILPESVCSNYYCGLIYSDLAEMPFNLKPQVSYYITFREYIDENKNGQLDPEELRTGWSAVKDDIQRFEIK